MPTSLALNLAPTFLARLPAARAAWDYAQAAHAGQIEHPLEVARLLHEAGCPDRVIAAGLLHETVEHGGVSPGELAERFGEDVAALVAAVTENQGIRSYSRRKAGLRQQVSAAGDEAAALFAADKLSKVRGFREQRVHTGGAMARSRLRRLLHYRQSLQMLEAAIPGHPLVAQLRRELGTLAGPAS